MYCAHCGKAIDANTKFCPYCGRATASAPEAVGSGPAPQPAATLAPEPVPEPSPAPEPEPEPAVEAPAPVVNGGGIAVRPLAILYAVVAGLALLVFAGVSSAIASRALGGDTELDEPIGIAAAIVLAALVLARMRSRGCIGAARPAPRLSAGLVAGPVVLNVGYSLLSWLLLNIPTYGSLLNSADAATYTFYDSTLVEGISSLLLYPVFEELFCRGVMLQLLLRAVCPCWDKGLSREQRDGITPTFAQFMVANVIQATVFGVIHLNLIQGIRAGINGLIFAWMWWRTGQLRWGMLAHMTNNVLPYVMGYLYGFCSIFFGVVGEILIPLALLLAGTWLFAAATEQSALGSSFPRVRARVASVLPRGKKKPGES